MSVDSRSSDLFGSAEEESEGGHGPAGPRLESYLEIMGQARVPDEYGKLYREHAVDGSVRVSALRDMMLSAYLAGHTVERILNVVFPAAGSHGHDNSVGEPQFNVAMALIGLAQEGYDTGLDTLADKVHSLPVPSFKSGGLPPAYGAPAPSYAPPNDSIESDPWGAGTAAGGAFDGSNVPAARAPSPGAAEAMQPEASQTIESTRLALEDRDDITMHVVPQKSGILMFRHIDYTVHSKRFGTQVVRRYSDFFWLGELLIKRYPFRRVPVLPPKRLAVNGHYLSGDASFLERRRRGLVRFMNSVMSHPILKNDSVVRTFVTVPTDVLLIKKSSSSNEHDEFGEHDPIALEAQDASVEDRAHDELIGNLRAALKIAIGSFNSLCRSAERIYRREEAIAADFMRIGFAMNSILDPDVYKKLYGSFANPETSTGLQAVSRHLQSAQYLLEEQAKSYDENFLEDLKSERDHIGAMLALFDRLDVQGRNTIAQSERRIETCQRKLVELDSKPQVKESDRAKLESTIIRETQSIADQHRRSGLIRRCVVQEIQIFTLQQDRLGSIFVNFSVEQVKFSELNQANWQSLSQQTSVMIP